MTNASAAAFTDPCARLNWSDAGLKGTADGSLRQIPAQRFQQFPRDCQSDGLSFPASPALLSSSQRNIPWISHCSAAAIGSSAAPALAQSKPPASVTFPRGFKTREIAANGTTIHVRVGGKGPAVVLLHGYGEAGDMWAPLKSFGLTMAVVMRSVADNVTEGIVPDSGHWIMEENPKATVALARGFLG